LRTILDKKVLPSLDPLLENSKLEPDLRTSVQENIAVLLNRSSSFPLENNDIKGENNLLFCHPNNNGGNGIHTNSSVIKVNNQNPMSQDMVNFPPNPLPGNGGSPAIPILSSPDLKFDVAANSIAFTPSSFDPPQIKILSSSDPESPSLISLAEPEPAFSDDSDGEDDVENDNIPVKSCKYFNNYCGGKECGCASMKRKIHVDHLYFTVLSASIPMRNSPTLGTSVEEAERSKIFELVQTLAANLRIPLESMLNSSNASSSDQ